MIWKWLRPRADEDQLATTSAPIIATGSDHVTRQIGRVDSVCPNCEMALIKRPGRKAKCPHCGNFIYVRTRPSDRQRVLVTEIEAAQIEAEWEFAKVVPLSLEGFKERYSGEREEFEREYALLSRKFGGPPSFRDVRWSMLNKQIIEHSSQSNWGLYWSARLDMAKVLHADGRLNAAFATYLEVYYLDLNGPRNMSGSTDPWITEKYPPFLPGRSSPAPYALNLANSILKQLTLDRSDVRVLFLDQVQQHCSHLPLPLLSEVAWPLIEAELFDGHLEAK